MYQNVNYFHGLNGLRFFAAYLVVIHHSEHILLKNSIQNLKAYSIFNNGGLAVNFFFVLSGFLITYLLLKEIKLTSNIAVKKFYVRRILRIWPLYYLLVFFGTILIPLFLDTINNPYQMPYEFKDVILYYVFFAPFMVNIIYGHHLIEPLWSIGVEEIFYLMWAPLFKFLKQHILLIISSVILIRILILASYPMLDLSDSIIRIIKMLKFESMAIGGLSAYIIFHRKKPIYQSVIFKKSTQVIMISFIALKLFANQYLTQNFTFFNHLYYTPIVSDLLMTISFSWLIVNTSINKNAIIKFNHKILNSLGEISYGIYMYHMLIIFSIILVFKDTLKSLSFIQSTILFHSLIFIGTIIISYLSKKYFEDYFLSMKNKFQ